MLVIGVDSGGTFTDTVIAGDDGRVGIGKALSTPSERAVGVLDSVRIAAESLGMTLQEALAEARFLAHGTTAGVNALLTGQGSKVGLLITQGFEDTIPIARINKALGLSEEDLNDATRWDKPPPLVPRRLIRGVAERVDARGRVVTPLDEEAARREIRFLGAQGVEAIGVCLLWSFVRPEHERRLGELVAEELPGVRVTLSSELVSRLGEYERAMTVVLNCYVGEVVSAYLRDLEERLVAEGLRGPLFVLQSAGGVQRASRIADRPVETLMSGPIGGVGAAVAVGRQLGHERIISTDVGGTSFDVGMVVDGHTPFAKRPMIGRYPIATPVVDIESIGTGGGSIAWLDPDTGGLRVGPRSAGADPGPACYGRGGAEPTVTDAAAVLGYLESLGGSLDLSIDAAEKAIDACIAAPMGVDVRAAAEGILRVANAQMADLVRRVTIQRGHDPRDAVLYAFGGAAPQYAGRYAADLGVRAVVIPAHASVFSAFGAVATDLRATATLDAPRPFPPTAEWMEDALAALESQARRELGEERSDLVLRRWAGMRFRRQVHELRVDVPAGPVSDDALEAMLASFLAEYERLFGSGTAYRDAGLELIGLRVDVAAPLPHPPHRRVGASSTTPVRTRHAWFDGEQHPCPVYDGDTVKSNYRVEGPAFVEMPTTTVIVYPGQSAVVDDLGHVTLDLGSRR